ncbi:MAG TPA: protease pro-enzyme activation domain-containing protein [Bryobacteraceae bacterium]|nr:protease pro-enzyme activation domain-containing protein [Bryobacteraceae bacterium]
MLLAASGHLFAQRNRITGRVDNARRVALAGHVHPDARAANDQGRVDPGMPLPYVTIELKPSAAQQAELDQLLQQQQDPSSPNYHRWLSPEQYADRFGVSQDDLAKLTAWLQQQHLTIAGVARARNWVAVSGTAAEFETAFSAEIHHYLVNGNLHFANVTAPSIPKAFQAVVRGIRGLHDFRMKPAAVGARVLHPNQTSSRGNHYLAPDDFATIYNLRPLYGNGIDGSGAKIAVVGQTQINLDDIQSFRNHFNLPPNNPQVLLVPNSSDPGVSSGDLTEADLDIEWAGAVARNAAILYVYANDVMTAAQYAIDQNLASVVSISYGQCELQTLPSEALNMESWGKQANLEGMTWVAASGDAGAADCVGGGTRNGGGLSVDLPAGLPEVTGIGGTEFNDSGGTYWNLTNDANQSSVLSYIPETAWNDSALDGQPSASGGGASMFFPKPSWQTGAGVPLDGARDVPDISLAGSADHDGYLVYSGGSMVVVGGTSAGSPAFAGITALLGEYLMNTGVQGQPEVGNVNPRLYQLAQVSPSVFHDITTGNNIVTPCTSKTRFCTASPIGYQAGSGYDLVTGLGSLDVNGLILTWHEGKAVTRGASLMQLSSSLITVPVAGNVVLTAVVTSPNGGVPGGTVTFSLGSTELGTAPLANLNGAATATLALNAASLPVGSDAITAQYGGDAAYNGSTASVTLTVTYAPSAPPSISGLSNAASYKAAFAPGMIASIFGQQLAPAAATFLAVPLPTQLAGVSVTVNGVAAPLYYVSPAQLNVQIPYGIAVNTTAVVTVNNNGQTTSATIPVAAAAPGIFTDASFAPVPNTSAAPGQIVTLYLTGDGALSPPLDTGTGPAAGTPLASLPHPSQTVTVTVGNLPAQIKFIGVPPGYVGVTQINYQVPQQVALGTQPVVVTIGGIPSASATLAITQ